MVPGASWNDKIPPDFFMLIFFISNLISVFQQHGPVSIVYTKLSVTAQKKKGCDEHVRIQSNSRLEKRH